VRVRTEELNVTVVVTIGIAGLGAPVRRVRVCDVVKVVRP
jgi:hypothetical protein